LLKLASSYVENDHQSYRQTTRPSGRVIGYQSAASREEIDERALDPTTLWRTLAWLGCQATALQTGLRLLGEHDPGDLSHRFVGAVAPHKFRSAKRQQTLTLARKLLHLIDHWDRTFGEPFFPRFATRARVP
jgi:hypothetical protein